MKSDRSELDDLVAKILPKGATPRHLSPAALLDESVVPPARVAEKVEALRALLRTGGRLEPLSERIGSSSDVVAYFQPRLAAEPVESMWVVGLDAKNRVRVERRVALGGTASCAVTPSDLFRPLVLNAAVGTILVHNHPSGDPAPSADDIVFTERAARAGDLLGVRVLDHVIVGGEGAFSFLEAGLLPRSR